MFSRSPHPSLRWRLLRAVGIASLLVWIAVGTLSYQQAHDEAEELMDGHLAQSAHLLLALINNNEGQHNNLEQRLRAVRGAPDNPYEPPLEFQIGLANGDILLRSEHAPPVPILGVLGYHDIHRPHGGWRILNTLSPDGVYRIQVAQDIELHDQAAYEVASHTVFPLALILPVLFGLIYLSVRRGLQPLEQLAEDVASQTPDTLSTLPARQVPSEAIPLVDALNQLFQRLEHVRENERRFTADAAHELRTPLAALKIQTQVAQLADDPETRAHAFEQMMAGVDRAGHLVGQLLRLARLDPLSSLPNPQPLRLRDSLENTVASVLNANPALTQQLDLCWPEQPVSILGDRELLEIALRNLIDNAFKYTPELGTIRIELAETPTAVTVRIVDNGPGIPAEDLPKLSERFYRHKENTQEGNGLGLAITARIAALHHAKLAFNNVLPHGLCASLTWIKTN